MPVLNRMVRICRSKASAIPFMPQRLICVKPHGRLCTTRSGEKADSDAPLSWWRRLRHVEPGTRHGYARNRYCCGGPPWNRIGGSFPQIARQCGRRKFMNSMGARDVVADIVKSAVMCRYCAERGLRNGAEEVLHAGAFMMRRMEGS
jgi:hypothetical protein